MVRPFRDEVQDYRRMAEWLSDERVLKWYGGRDKPFDMEGIRARYGPRARGEQPVKPCVIERHGRPIGYIQHYPVEEAGDYHLEDAADAHGIDLFIGEVELWGKGLGTTALRAVVRHLVDDAGSRRVLIDPLVDNARAIRSYEKAGFVKVKVLAEHELHEGERRDCWLMAVDGTAPTLETADLVLEPICMEHAASLQQHFADREVIKHLSSEVPWPYPADGVECFLRDSLLPRVQSGDAMAWALVPRSHGQAVGLLEWRRDPRTTDDRGFWLARAWWGRGLMTQAVIAFQDWVFFQRGIERLRVRNAVENIGSRRVKEKTGATYVGRTQCAHHEGDEAELWEVTRESWAAHRIV
ncbi:MAG: GNAT family N-acetyltransferase [bacterium]|nr:GNAT family N-acetyltransferase [bacterium]